MFIKYKNAQDNFKFVLINPRHIVSITGERDADGKELNHCVIHTVDGKQHLVANAATYVHERIPNSA